MVELLLILFGGREVRRWWWSIGLAGLVWGGLGAFFFVNALIEDVRVPPVYFAIPLGIEGAVALVAALGASGGMRMLRLGQGIVLFGLALLIGLYPWHGGIIVGFLVGMLLVADASWRAVSAYVVRYAGWRLSILFAGLEFVSGCFSFIPWPTQWAGEVGCDVGIWLIVSAAGICAVALRLRRLPEGRSVAALFTRGWPDGERPAGSAVGVHTPLARCEATVHVWTPTGRLVPVNHGLTRYVAALDERGIVSTGHAALEAPGLYISHYPAIEIDRSKIDFRRLLRASHDNDVPGRFLPAYDTEAADWQPSTMRVRVAGLHAGQLAAFWDAYRGDTHYNLTDRNCSSAVAKALDAGLEGLFAARRRSLRVVLGLLTAPEVWIAGFLRHRAAAMAWTPGLVLDYARALAVVAALAERRREAGAPQ